MLVRFVAAALIGWAVMDCALYIVVCRHKGVPVGAVRCVIKAIPFVLGVVLLAKSKAVAAWVSDKLDF